MSEAARVTSICMIALCAAIATIAGCSGYENHDDNMAMTLMVKSGSSPIEARCAVKSMTTSCSIIASGIAHNK